MLITIKGYYNHGKITLAEAPPAIDAADVIVTFLKADEALESRQSERKFGGLEGLIKLPNDFNEPLDEMKDYL